MPKDWLRPPCPLVAMPRMRSLLRIVTVPSDRPSSPAMPTSKRAPSVRCSAISPPLFTYARVRSAASTMADNTSAATAPATQIIGVVSPSAWGKAARYMARAILPFGLVFTGRRSRGSSVVSSDRIVPKRSKPARNARSRAPSAPMTRSIGPWDRCSLPPGRRAACAVMSGPSTSRSFPARSGLVAAVAAPPVAHHR